MADETTVTRMPRCLNCGFEAPLENGEWNSAEVPPLGAITRCPNCGSTNILGRW